MLESLEPVALERLSAFVEGLLARFGDALLRYKGVVEVVNEPRESVLVFIGDDQPEDEIRQGFAKALSRP